MKQVSQQLIARRRVLVKHFHDISRGQLMIPEVYPDGEAEIGTSENQRCFLLVSTLGLNFGG